MNFAAFIMTYERPGELLHTIECLTRQTHPPQKILVVDNSAGQETEEAINRLNRPEIQYHRTGYNSGPAGAAKIGLSKLAKEGYEWVYWGDDNNPPRTLDAFERIFEMHRRIDNKKKIGALGLMGNHFSLNRVMIELIKEDDLQGILAVNSLAGDGTMVINTKVLKDSGVCPDENLFFGYEELDFCLQIKKAGYEIFIDGDYYREQKKQSKKVKKTRLQKISVNSRSTTLWREYYSIRNLLAIVYWKHKSSVGLVLILSRVLGKIIYSYSKGFSFGLKYSRLASKAVYDFVIKHMGLVVKPGSI